MALETRWFLTTLSRLSQIPKWKMNQSRGFLPGFLEFLDPAVDPIGKAGSWFGIMTAPGVGFALGAITIDNEKHSPAEISALWGKLEAAPDSRVFDMRASLTTRESAWARRDSFATELEGRLIDVGRFRNPTKDLAHHLREVARTLTLYQALGRHFHPLDLTAQFSALAPVGLLALVEHLEEIGFPPAKLPNSTTTFKNFYRAALADPWTDFGIDSGAWHLAHPSANLKKT